MNLIKMYKAGAVKRWHTRTTIKEQDVAAHSWGVAMIVKEIYPQANADLLMAALTHDLHEIESGDIPYPFKKKNAQVRLGVELQESQFVKENGLPQPAESLIHILKWADMFELYLWCRREAGLGNQTMLDTVDVAYKALRDMGPPTKRAEELFKEAL